MRCPVCPDTTLVMSDRQGVEIDYCPQCRGVWLDRGELDKIIDRMAGAATAPAEPSRPAASIGTPASNQYAAQYNPRPEARHQGNHDFGHGNQHGAHYQRKKKSLLGELFDFD